MKLILSIIFLCTGFFAQAIPLNDFKKMGIAAEATKLTEPRLKNLEYSEDQYVLQVTLGRLTSDQFKSLKSYYGNFSQVPYSAERAYELTDFLHPFIQASINKVFAPIYYDGTALIEADQSKLSDDEQGVFATVTKGPSSFTNCWNTTTQIIRLMHPSLSHMPMNVQLYWPARWNVDDQLRDSALSTVVPESDLRPGDVLMISNLADNANSESGMVQHLALVLSDTLLFEKTDSSENDAYRISFRKDVLAKYEKLFSDEDRVIEYRRFNQPGQEAYPDDEPFKISTMVTPDGMDLLRKVTPELVDFDYVLGCETADGGGCSAIFSRILDAQVVLDPLTGRGVFKAEPEVLSRFTDLHTSLK